MEIAVKDIQEALERYRLDFEYGEGAWIAVPHWWYPWGLDVHFELDDDKDSPSYNRLRAWVYPNVQREESAYLETDTNTLLATFPLEETRS